MWLWDYRPGMTKYSPPPVLPALRFDTRSGVVRLFRELIADLFSHEHDVVLRRLSVLDDFRAAAERWLLWFSAVAPQQDLADLRSEVDQAVDIAVRLRDGVPDDVDTGTMLDWDGVPRWTEARSFWVPKPNRPFGAWDMVRRLQDLRWRIVQAQAERHLL